MMRAREEKSNSGKITKKKMFVEITEKMHKEGYTFTREQVQGMWKTLVTGLKKTKDHINHIR
jgi:GTP cyclohydrolase I